MGVLLLPLTFQSKNALSMSVSDPPMRGSNHNGSTPLVLAKRRGVNKDAIRLLEGLEEQEVKGFNRGPHSKLETMQMADSER